MSRLSFVFIILAFAIGGSRIALADISASSDSNQSKKNDIEMLNALLSKGQRDSATPSAKPVPTPQTPSLNLPALPSDKGTLNDQAFADMFRNLMPLSPDQIRSLHYYLDESQRAANAYPSAPPKPTSSSVLVDLSPGATPPVARLSLGFVSSLVFLDATGAPWPIQAYDVGDPASFNIQWNKKDNKLLVQALKSYKFGNLAVILKGLDTPIILTLIPGQTAIDYRLDLRIPARGPNAHLMLQGLPPTVSSQLLKVLNGVPPSGSTPLMVQGGLCEAWLLGDRLYLRTSMTLLSPAWISMLSSADGTHAYELQNTPVVLASQEGKLTTVKIQGF